MLRSIAAHSKEATQVTFLKRPKASTLHPPRLLEEKWWIMFYLDFSELSTLEKNKNAYPENLMYIPIDMLPSQRPSCIQQRIILPMRILQVKRFDFGGREWESRASMCSISELDPGLDFFSSYFYFLFYRNILFASNSLAFC